MGIAGKEGSLSVFDTDILNKFLLPNAEMTAWPLGKIDKHTPAGEELKKLNFMGK